MQLTLWLFTASGFGASSPPFGSAAVSLPREAFQSPGTGYKPPVPSDRYAALAELDCTRGTSFPGAYNWDINADAGTKTGWLGSLFLFLSLKS